MNRTTPLALCLVLLALPTLAQEEDWLPRPVEAGAVDQLAQRIHLAFGEEGIPDRSEQAAQILIAGLREVLEDQGVTGTLDLAPRFAALEIPSTGQRHLDAMVAYQICNLVLVRQAEDPAFRDDQNAQFTSAVGLSAITLAILHLRHPYLQEGGEEDRIEAALTAPSLETVLEGMRNDIELRGQIEDRCQPVVWTLLERPMSRLGPSEE